jgi:hypothetical protein
VTKGDSGGDRTETSGYRRKISNDRSETAVTGGRIAVTGQRHNVRREDSNDRSETAVKGGRIMLKRGRQR